MRELLMDPIPRWLKKIKRNRETKRKIKAESNCQYYMKVEVKAP